MKKYQGKTVAEAFSQAKLELGEDVMIFNTDYQRTPNGTVVEILVSPPQTESKEEAPALAAQPTLASQSVSKAEPLSVLKDSLEKIVPQPVKEIKKEIQKEIPVKAVYSFDAEDRFKSIEDKLNYLTESVVFMNSNIGTSESSENLHLYNYLKDEQEVSALNAKKIMNRLKDKESLSELKNTLKDILKVKEGITIKEEGQTRVAFVGPTGVGKTTTIAKTAALLTFTEKKKVGIICMDSYRIGAEAQLRLYGDIMNVPVVNAANINDLKLKLESFADKDVILIDTAGKSQHSGMQLMEIANSLKSVEGLDVYLTIALNLRQRDINDVIENFKVMDYKGIVFTKIDETCVYGTMLNVFMDTDKEIRYITCGQNVPEDIIIPTKDYIIKTIFKNFKAEMEPVCS